MIEQRYQGLTLAKRDRRAIAQMQRDQTKMTVRTWRRVRILELLDGGTSQRATGRAVGTYGREVGRIARRYLANGLHHALTDDARPTRPRRLDSTQQAALVALACGPAPVGRARWTVRLLTEHAKQRGISDVLGRETVRIVLADHALKPWLKKNVVRTKD